MKFDYSRPQPPTDDPRWKMVETTMRRHGTAPRALIETLHTVQDVFGHLDADALRYVAVSLRVPYSKVYGVATFYHHFRLQPQGAHRCVICTGTACHIKGAGRIVEAIEAEFGVEAGDTTADGQLSLTTARCIGACGIAPVAVFDDDVAGKLGVDDTLEHVRRLLEPLQEVSGDAR